MDIKRIIGEQFNNVIPKDKLDEITNKVNQISNGLLDNISVDSILDNTIKGESIFEFKSIISNLEDLLLIEVKSALILCVEILSICIIIGVLNGLSSSFNSKSVSEISLLICTMIIIGISINSFNITYSLAMDITEIMSKTMEILLPILIGILVSTGSIASGTILSPVLITASTITSYLINNFILPALFISTILTLINCLTEKNYVNKLSKLVRKVTISLTGLLLVIFSGIISIQGLLTETSDGILINTAKYSISNFIPIVGGFTSDTVELYIRCMGTIKNVVGIFGIVTLIALISVPLIKIFLIGLIYKLTAALVEPISTSKISDGLNEMGSCVVSLGAIIIFNSLLFLIFITTIISIGG